MTTERRLFLAIVLSFAVALVWSKFTPRPESKAPSSPVAPANTVSPASGSFSSSASVSNPAALVPAAVTPKNEIADQIRLDNIEFDFNGNGDIVEAKFPKYSQESFKIFQGFSISDLSSFKKVSVNKSATEYLYSDQEKQVKKTLKFKSDIFYFDFDLEIKNLLAQELTYNKPILVGIIDYSDKGKQSQYSDITVWANGKPQHFNGKKEITVENIKYVGIRNRFFCAIIEPKSGNHTALIKKINEQQSALFIVSENKIAAKGSAKESYKAYLGPQDADLIATINPQWNGLIYYGTFDPISKIILKTLGFMQKFLKNWGVSIIGLSVLIYFLLFPLSYKQMHSMKKMQMLQPKVEELKKEYKDNPQKLNQEIMELYRENKVNPLGGCLPMLLQIPVFFALYQALIRSTSIKDAHFLWIKDLASPDKLFTLPFNIPLLGNEFNLLPLLMAGGMFFQQKLTASSSSGMPPEQQKMMQILFPIMFAFIFYKMPSGLVLYWFVNSILMLVYQVKINKTLS